MGKRVIHTVFEQQVLQSPENTAIVHGKESVSYRELNNKANRLAHSLRSLGLYREAVVLSVLPAGIPMVAGLLGIQKAGGVYLPLDQSFPPAAVARLATDTNANFCLVAAPWLARTQEWLLKAGLQIHYLLSVNDEASYTIFEYKNGAYAELSEANQPASCNPSLISEPQDGSYIFCASGAVSDLKPVMGTHDGLSHFIQWEIKEFNVRPGMTVSFLNPAYSDISLRDILLPLCAGGVLAIPSAEINNSFLLLTKWIESAGITIMHATPSLLRQMVWAANGRSLPAPALRHLLLSGEALYGQDVADGRELLGEGVEFVNLYGATETTLAKTFHRISGFFQSDALIPAGQPISNTMVLVVSNGKQCNVGEAGEIYIASPFLARGYAGETKTQAFVQNPLVHDRKEIVYKTGDRGRYLPGYSLEVMSRTDGQIKINSFTIDTAAINKVLLSCAGVLQAETIMYKSDVIAPAVLCYFTGNAEFKELKSRLGAAFIAQVLPAYYTRLQTFPIVAPGVVNRKELPVPGEITGMEQEAGAPRGRVELVLESICKELLQIRKPGRRLSFFRIGGSSVKAMQYIFRIYKELGVLLTFEEFYENSSIEKLASFLSTQLDASGEGRPLSPEQKEEMEIFRQSMLKPI